MLVTVSSGRHKGRPPQYQKKKYKEHVSSLSEDNFLILELTSLPIWSLKETVWWHVQLNRGWGSNYIITRKEGEVHYNTQEQEQDLLREKEEKLSKNIYFVEYQLSTIQVRLPYFAITNTKEWIWLNWEQIIVVMTPLSSVVTIIQCRQWIVPRDYSKLPLGLTEAVISGKK